MKTRSVSREATEPLAVACERVHLDACGLSEVLFKGNSESAAQALVDEMEVERRVEAEVEESPKCLYQSSSEDEDTVQRIESPIQIALVCCERSSVAKLTARVLHRHGPTDRWCSASPRSVTMATAQGRE